MTTTHTAVKKPATWPIWVLAVPAGVAIWAGWVELGMLCGYGKVRPLPGIADHFVINSAITLPIGVEAYAAIALRAALDPRTPPTARRFAKRSAGAALVLGMGGQIAYHVMHAAGLTQAPWWVTAVVACLPVLVLGAGAALSHLLMHDDPADHTAPLTTKPVEPQHVPAPAPADTTANTTPQTPDHTKPTKTPKPKPQRRTKKTASTTTVPAGGKAARARRVAAEHPGWTHQQIADEVGCTVRTVGRALTDQDQPAPPAPFAKPLGPLHQDTILEEVAA